MNSLTNTYSLSNTIELYIPSNIHGIDNIELQQHYVNDISEKFTLLFGGSTLIETVSTWLNKKRKIIREKIVIIQSFADTLNDADINEVVSIAQHLKIELQQDAVSLKINNKLYFI
jgi:hypothetical protein